ncbi:MAG: 6,7-dimethyl-8-ribityllumazine synthase [Sphingobacteriales bacterium]|jgi:6,7-dimethyl-8-ribityllumazine synthase
MASSLKSLSDFSHTTIPSGTGMRVAIIVAEWNSEVTGKLLKGAYDLLTRQGVQETDILVYPVPGSYELIGGATMVAESASVDAVICLGCVIQGETPHFDFICQGVANGLGNLNIKFNMPFIFGVLTTLNQEQALDRSGGKHGNKGEEAAVTALKMMEMQNHLLTSDV